MNLFTLLQKIVYFIAENCLLYCRKLFTLLQKFVYFIAEICLLCKADKEYCSNLFTVQDKRGRLERRIDGKVNK